MKSNIVPEQGKVYRISWKGEKGEIMATFDKKERGFYVFWSGDEKVVCSPNSIILNIRDCSRRALNEEIKEKNELEE